MFNSLIRVYKCDGYGIEVKQILDGLVPSKTPLYTPVLYDCRGVGQDVGGTEGADTQQLVLSPRYQ